MAKKQTVDIKIKRLNETAILPTRERDTDAGWDLYCNAKTIVPANTVKAIPTGIAIEIPKGYYMSIEERSGYSLRNTLGRKAGIIDSEYRGEIKVVIQNSGVYPTTIEKDEKFAQMILHELPSTIVSEVTELADTSRGEKGFGSSDQPKAGNE